MAQKKKEFWYVLVFTSEGPKYVTSLGDHHTAHWDMLEVPLEMPKSRAIDVTTGLLLNWYNANAVCMPVQLTHQPYYYEHGVMQFVEKEEDKDDGEG